MDRLKFTNGESGFAYKGWTVTVYRSRLGNKLEGYHYLHSYEAAKCEKKPDGIGFSITATLRGNGGKSKAIEAINSYILQEIAGIHYKPNH